MRSYASNQDFYKHIDEVVADLRSIGFESHARKIQFILHETAWTTTSELFGELRDEFDELLASPRQLPIPLREALMHLTSTIDTSFDRENGLA